MDIVERLRSHWGGERIADVSKDVADAADEIERLRLANSDLQMYYDYAKSEVLKFEEEFARMKIWNDKVQNKWMWVESAMQFIAMAKPLDGQTWEEHSKQITAYAIKAIKWKEPD